jgi:prepilin-type N-terminal cleavage/methylation domain-containing protein
MVKEVAQPARAAFTMIELLVVISIVAVLVSLLAPALGRARDTSRQVVSMSNVRSIQQLLDQYGNSCSDLMPAPIIGAFYPSIRPEFANTIHPWDAYAFWMGLISVTASWDELRPVINSPGRRFPTELPTHYTSSYHIVMCTQAKPDAWTVRCDLNMPFGGNRFPDVAFPAQKVHVFDTDLAYVRRAKSYRGEDLFEQAPTGFFDGHVAIHVPAEASEPFESPLLAGVRNTQRLFHTRDGIRGVDY